MVAERTKTRAPAILAAGILAVGLLIGGFYAASRWRPFGTQSRVNKPSVMGPRQQAYAQQIRFVNPRLARATNFLNQEVTFVFGSVSNEGTSSIRQVEVTLEFEDSFKQVVLRDTQRLFGPNADPLASHQHRDFQLNFEMLPATWAQTYPTIRVTGLDLQ